jgi:hypothetical protein
MAIPPRVPQEDRHPGSEIAVPGPPIRKVALLSIECHLTRALPGLRMLISKERMFFRLRCVTSQVLQTLIIRAPQKDIIKQAK